MQTNWISHGVLVMAVCGMLCAAGGCSEKPEQDTPEPEPAVQQKPEQTAGENGAHEPELGPVILPEAIPFENDEALDDWMVFYYTDPQPQQIVPALRRLAENGTLNDAPRRNGMAFFFARILEANDSHARAWAEALDDLPMLPRAFFAQALTIAGTDECYLAVQDMATRTADESLAEGLRAMHKMPTVQPLDMPLEHPGVISMLWAEFSATGDPLCIERLASIGHHVIQRKDPEMMVVAVKAMHELTMHATRHPRVLDTLKRLAREAHGAQQQALHNCIDDAGVVLDQMKAAEESTE